MASTIDPRTIAALEQSSPPVAYQKMNWGILAPIDIITDNGTAQNRTAFTVPIELLTQNSAQFREMFAQHPYSTAYHWPSLDALSFDFYLRFLTGAMRDLIAEVRKQADRRCPIVRSPPQVEHEPGSSPSTIGRVANRIEGIAMGSPNHQPPQQQLCSDQQPQPTGDVLSHDTYMLQSLCTIWFSAQTFRDPKYCNAVIDAMLQLPNLGQCAIRAIAEWEGRAPASMETARHLEEDTPLLRLLVDCVAAATTPDEMREKLLDHTWSFDFGSKLTLRIFDSMRNGMEVRPPRLGDRRWYYYST